MRNSKRRLVFWKGCFFFQINVMFWLWLLCGFPYSFQFSSWIWGFCLLSCCGEWKPSGLGILRMLLKILHNFFSKGQRGDATMVRQTGEVSENDDDLPISGKKHWKGWFGLRKQKNIFPCKGGGGVGWGFFGGLPKPVWCFKRIHRFPFCEHCSFQINNFSTCHYLSVCIVKSNINTYIYM